ncbi:MAG: hypothetical protein EOP11_15665 [Proteobacteria bacterium]|nr:MAG: hypothetical protein EOP11_15665 [Pseudomonadota bacterium]
MKNIFLALGLLLASAPTFAATQCPTDASEVEKMISSAGSCYDAATIARDCAWGSSIDVMLAGTASAVCEKDYANMSRADKKTMETMRSRCATKYRDMDGTMYLSMSAHCQLQVSEFWSSIYTSL